MTVQSKFPKQLDVFLPLIDGFHPMSADDINAIMQAIENCQRTLGWGPEPSAAGAVGPKGDAANVAERLLNLFSETESTIRDFAFVTGSVELSALTDNGSGSLGLNIPFGVTMSGTDIIILFATNIPGDGSDGTQSQNATGAWWVSQISTSSVWIQARLANGDQITTDNETSVNYGILAFGPRAHY